MNAVFGRILGVRRPDSLSESSSGPGLGELSRDRNRLRLNGDWLRARLRLRSVSLSFVDAAELERDLCFPLDSVRPRASSLVEVRDSDNAERPPMTELNANLLKEPVLRVLLSCVLTELTAEAGVGGTDKLRRSRPLEGLGGSICSSEDGGAGMERDKGVVSILANEAVDQRFEIECGCPEEEEGREDLEVDEGLEGDEGVAAEAEIGLRLVGLLGAERVNGTRSSSDVVLVTLDIVRESDNSLPSCGVGSVGPSLLETDPYFGIQLRRRVVFCELSPSIIDDFYVYVDATRRGGRNKK